MSTSALPRDPSTLSNYHQFSVKSTKLHFNVIFDESRVTGSVTYDLDVKNSPCHTIDLDTSYLSIGNVEVNGLVCQYTLSDRHSSLGQRLSISMPKPLESFSVSIEFATTEKCTALQFLPKEATDGKKSPYLFCQCQAIHARSLFPCFDTPSVKSPYHLSASSPFFTLMSGLYLHSEGNTHFFDQKVPIPSYLVSIASGDIVGLPIGPRSTVYSEPVNVEACQWEFEKDMEGFIQIAERLIFAYEWVRFDSLVMPKGFPYGGMEIPNLCQLTPTLVCKDRSQVLVMAHELAHSWLGNLVTNCSWEHFWLNEGWTVYIERRIAAGIAANEAKEHGHANPVAYGEAVRHFDAIIGWNALENSIRAMSEDRFSTLIQDLQDGTDPDDSFSLVPYEKGFNFLFHIEQTVGGLTEFDPFIKHYFSKYRYQLVSTEQFKETLFEFFNEKHAELAAIDWNMWLFGKGLPPRPKFNTELADECYALAERWKTAIEQDLPLEAEFSEKDVLGFNANQLVLFLETLLSYGNWPKHSKQVEVMTRIYPHYLNPQNAEIVFRWYMLQVTSHIEQSYDALGNWLGTVGRMKFVRPGYTLLNKVCRGKALFYFDKFKDSYHPICCLLVKKDLGL